jgi:hypothetical protein
MGNSGTQERVAAPAAATALTIDAAAFRAAVEREVDANDEPTQSVYLNIRTGEIVRLYAYDEDAERQGVCSSRNQEACMKVASAPEMYLNVPGRTYADELKILQDFIASEWTADAGLRQAAKSAFKGSVAGWMKQFNFEGPVPAYCAFRNAKLEKLGDELLRSNGIAPDWK